MFTSDQFMGKNDADYWCCRLAVRISPNATRSKPAF